MIKYYPVPEGEKISSLYSVKLGNIDVDCYSCIVKGKSFAVGNVNVNYDLSDYVNEEAAFLYFDMSADDTAVLTVTLPRDFSEAVVRPLSKKVKFSCYERSVKIEISKCGQYTLECDGHHGALHIFVNPLTDFGIKSDAPNIIYFGPGIHNPEQIRMKDGDTLFIDGGAVVHGSIREYNVSNITIAGHGILDRGTVYSQGTGSGVMSVPKAIYFENCSNIAICGITIKDSPQWVITLANCNNVVIDNIKQIGMWSGSTDGIDIVNSQNITVNNSFFRNGDDNITLKGFAPYMHQNVENILVKGCVLWCDWGCNLQIGAEVCADVYRNIAFIDCDIIHSAHAALSFQSGGYADISHVIYENIRVEYSKYMREAMLYIGDTEDKTQTHGHIQIRTETGETEAVNAGDVPSKEGYVDHLFRTITRPASELAGIKYEPKNEPYLAWLIYMEICEHWHDILSPDMPFANNHIINFKNIQVLLDEGLPNPPSRIEGYSSISRTYDVKIDNLTINGDHITSTQKGNIVLGKYTDNITIF